MADTNPADIGQLNDSQQTALATYIAVTNQEASAAIPLLQRSQWNVQIAIAKFFDGEAPDPVQQALALQDEPPPPRQSSRREVLLSSGIPSRSVSSSSREAAPRIVPQPEGRNVFKPSLILSLLLAPVGLLLRLISGSLGIFGYLFPFVPRLLSSFRNSGPSRTTRRNTTGRRPLNPRDTAARFIREFGEEFGDHTLQFFENGYAQAYDMAKKDLKYLLVILLSPEHDDTTAFVRETLLSREFRSFVNNPENKIVLWAGNVQDSEAYQVSVALNCTKFPFGALIVHTPQDSPAAMSTVARVTGPLTPTAFVSKLRTAISQNSTALERIRAARAEQEASRNLRQEQNSAYERSLAQDRERARLRREAEAAQARLEQETKAKAEVSEQAARDLAQWKQWKALKIAPEPPADVKEATRLSIRMLSGDRVIRRFPPQASMNDLYAFVECHDIFESAPFSPQSSPPAGYEHEYKFRLVSPMPRMIYDLAAGGTVGERIGRSGNLIVESTVDDEDEDDV